MRLIALTRNPHRPPRALVPGALATAALLAAPTLALAGEPEGMDSGDTAWILVSCALVMLMMPGLALFYGGLVRKKNVLSTMMHSFVVLGLITIQWIVVGYSIAFGTGVGVGDMTFFGNPMDKFMLSGVTDQSMSGSIPEYVFIAFQMMFAIITPALISGAYAERFKFSSYVLFTLLWATFIYDPLCHMVWGGGWMGARGALDFAGGTVVHISSGVSALVVAYVLGARKGFPQQAMFPHNLTMTLLGAGMLWFGWFGFNAGSALTSGTSAGNAFLVTQIAAGAGALGWLIMEQVKHGKPSALGMASGLVAGLVAITPAAGFVGPQWAIVVGLGAGVLCFYAVEAKTKLGYDDSLDAFGVHGIGGTWGALATGLFATVGATGLVMGDVGQFVEQIIGVVFTWVYAGVGTFVLLKIVGAVTGGIRVSDEDEERGCDETLHGERGYVT